MTAIAATVQAFFTDRLIRQRRASPHTIAAYRDTLRLLLVYAAQRHNTAPCRLDVADLDAPTIAAFLDHLEHQRGNSIRTRNARLAAIHSMFGFAALRHPEHTADISRVLAIPTKRTDHTIVTFLTDDAAHAMYFERDAAEKAIDSLFDAYAKLGHRDAAARLDIITRVYVLGSLAVRLRQWAVVHDLALRPYPPSGDAYVYSSWIRHGQVDASRADLFPKDKGGMMISAARVLMSEQPAMRPDVPDSAVPDPGDLGHDDALFNSLCQFDILYCLIVAAEGQHHGHGYPAASAMNQDRANPAFEVVASDPDARAAMFPTSDERKIAEAMTQVFTSAERESFGFGGHWCSLPQGAQRFVSNQLGEGT
jgi:hypothetical protein